MMALTDYQRELVENNLSVVDYVLRTRITMRGAALLTYEDFYQIGCEALCRAAAAYRPECGEFRPFAATAVYNAAIDHIRKQKMESTFFISLNTANSDDDERDEYPAISRSNTEQDMIDNELIRLIAGYRDKYTGVTRLGVEAILLKTLGYTNGDIADHYGTTTNNVRAWISRARARLQADQLTSSLK